MWRIDLQDGILLVELYVKNGESVFETILVYKRIQNIKDSGEPVALSTITALVRRWRETDSVAHRHYWGRSGSSEEMVNILADAVSTSDGQTSIRLLSGQLGID